MQAVHLSTLCFRLGRKVFLFYAAVNLSTLSKCLHFICYHGPFDFVERFAFLYAFKNLSTLSKGLRSIYYCESFDLVGRLLFTRLLWTLRPRQRLFFPFVINPSTLSQGCTSLDCCQDCDFFQCCRKVVFLSLPFCVCYFLHKPFIIVEWYPRCASTGSKCLLCFWKGYHGVVYTCFNLFILFERFELIGCREMDISTPSKGLLLMISDYRISSTPSKSLVWTLFLLVFVERPFDLVERWIFWVTFCIWTPKNTFDLVESSFSEGMINQAILMLFDLSQCPCDPSFMPLFLRIFYG